MPSVSTESYLALAGLIGGVGDAFSARSAGQSQRLAAESAASSARFNESLAQFDIDALMRNRDQVLSKLRRKTRATIGSQKAALSAAGIALDGASAQHIISDTDFFGQLDERTAITDFDRQAFAVRMQALGYSLKANEALAVGNQISPSLLGGAALTKGIARAVGVFAAPRAASPSVLNDTVDE